MSSDLLKDRSFLVIDDDLFSIKIVTEILERNGANVTGITKPDEGFGMGGSDKYDVVLLDRYMRDVDGHDILAQLKQHPVMKLVPVIMISGESKSEQIMNSIKLGASGYMVKPFDEKGLLHQIKKVLPDL
jgi:PleD family two-component response regulator